jgi:hypothetical protein
LSEAAGFTVIPGIPLSDGLKPADVMLSHWKAGGPLAIDVSVVHPLAPSIPFQSVETGAGRANDAEVKKHLKYDNSLAAVHLQFKPFILTTFGQLGAESSEFLDALLHYLVPSDSSHVERGTLISHYHQQLQIALKREIARMLLQGTQWHSPESADNPQCDMCSMAADQNMDDGAIPRNPLHTITSIPAPTLSLGSADTNSSEEAERPGDVNMAPPSPILSRRGGAFCEVRLPMTAPLPRQIPPPRLLPPNTVYHNPLPWQWTPHLLIRETRASFHLPVLMRTIAAPDLQQR